MRRLQWPIRLVLLTAFSYLACTGSNTDFEGEQEGDADRREIGIEQTGEEAAWDSPFEVQFPQLTDWDCPEGWRSVPGFVDEHGNENPPDGMAQFHICEPPDSWDGPSGPVRLKNWACPEDWQVVEHKEVLAEDGTPFSWCEPPESWDGPLGPVQLQDRNRYLGIQADSFATLHLSHAVVRDTRVKACALKPYGDPGRCLPDNMEGIARGWVPISERTWTPAIFW